jgi:hypothetical protein
MMRKVLMGPENAGRGEAKKEVKEKLHNTSARSFRQKRQ